MEEGRVAGQRAQREMTGAQRQKEEEVSDEELERLARASLRRKSNDESSVQASGHGRAYYFERADDARLAHACSTKLRRHPSHLRALRLRASCRSKLNDLDGALSDYQRILKLNPSDEDALYQRGSVFSRMQRLDDAITDFSSVLSTNPQHAKAAYARGACQNLKGDFQSAIGASLSLSLRSIPASCRCGNRSCNMTACACFPVLQLTIPSRLSLILPTHLPYHPQALKRHRRSNCAPSRVQTHQRLSANCFCNDMLLSYRKLQ